MTNQIIVKYSFANVGRTLSYNVKSATGNITCTGTVVRHSKLAVSFNNINVILAEGMVNQGRGTIAFSDRKQAEEYMALVNNSLIKANHVFVSIEAERIIYNGDVLNTSAKSLTIFNPSAATVVKTEVNSWQYSSTATAPAPLSPAIEKARNDYEEMLENSKQEVVPVVPVVPVVSNSSVEVTLPLTPQPLAQVSSARNSLNLLSEKDINLLIENGYSEEDLKQLEVAQIERILSFI